MGLFSIIGAGIGSLFGPVGTGVGAGLGGMLDSSKAGKPIQAASTERNAGINNAIDELRAQNPELQKYYSQMGEAYKPYTTAGLNAFNTNVENGNKNQEQIYADFLNQDQNSPLYQSIMKAQENTLLNNAAATGGVRGGNTQAALARLAPDVLEKLMSQRMNIENTGYNRNMDIAKIGGNLTQQYAQSGLDLGRQGLDIAKLIADYKYKQGIGNAQGAIDYANAQNSSQAGTLSSFMNPGSPGGIGNNPFASLGSSINAFSNFGGMNS